MKYCIILSLLFLFQFNFFSQNDSTKVDNNNKNIEVLIISNKNDSVIFYSEKNLALATKINYKRGIARSLSNLGIGNLNKGNYPEALKSYYKSLALYEIIKRPKGIMNQYNHIGQVYDCLKDYKKALEYDFKAIKLSESLNEKKEASIVYCNIGIIYSRLNDFKKAKFYISKALSIDKVENNLEGISRNLINMGFIHSEKKYDKQALKYFSEALTIAKELDDKVKIAICLANIGSAYASLKQNNEAEKYLLQAIFIADSIGAIDITSEFEFNISEFYATLKNYKQALIHYKKYSVLKDSIINEGKAKKIIATEMNYAFDKKEAATEFKHGKIIYKLEEENNLNKQLKIFFIISTLLFLGLLFFAKRAFDNKKKVAEFMASENNRKEILLQEVHHRINNNLQIISSLLTLQANSSDNDKLKGYLTQSQNRIQSLSILHELLYQNDSPLQINMQEYLNKVLDFHRTILSTLPIKVDIEMEVTNAIFPTKLAVPIALIVNELVTNSVKYGFKDAASGKVNILLAPIQNEKNAYILSVSDTGKGLPNDTNFRKDSLGLRLVTIITKQIKGTLIKSNTPGATFEIRFVV